MNSARTALKKRQSVHYTVKDSQSGTAREGSREAGGKPLRNKIGGLVEVGDREWGQG